MKVGKSDVSSCMPILTPASEVRRILVSRTDGLGDVICTLPIALAVKQSLPDVNLAFMVTPYTAPIARRIAEVDEVLTISRLRKGTHLIRIYHPDVIIFARPEFRLAVDAVLARIDVRIGTGYRFYSGLFTRWVYDHRRKGTKHESEYSVNLLGPLLDDRFPVEMPVLESSEGGVAERDRRLSEAGVVGEHMVLHPGSRGSAATWPAEKYGAVARALLKERSDLTVVVTAGPGERELAWRVVDEAGMAGRVVLLDDLTLDGLSELLRTARGFLGSSSGPAHLAALVRTPVVGLYPGLPPLWPPRWRPFGPHVTTLVPHPDEPLCRNCGKDHEPENCVARISTERALEACRGMLQGKDLGTADDIS